MRNELSKETRERLPPLKGNERHRLLETTRKVDEVMNKIEVGNITELNDLVYVGTVVVTEMLGVKNRKSTGFKVCVQDFWLKNFKSIQEGLRRNLQKCLKNRNVPMWMTKGRTMLMQKDKRKGQDSK